MLQKEKILIIRMLGLGDVTSIGIPALRHLMATHPSSSQFSFLTFAAGKEVITLAEESVNVISLEKDEWPDDIINAMNVFLSLAEDIISSKYTKIINLDTWFMPCFLARFLYDSGQNVVGNFINISISELVKRLQNKTLNPAYVNQPGNYIESSWDSMKRWNSYWWMQGLSPQNGYPEFFLRTCCEFHDIDIDMSIEVEPCHQLKEKRQNQPVIALALNARTSERNYPYGKELRNALEKKGVYIWTGFDGSVPLEETLSKLSASNLLVTVPSAPQWFGKSVGCKSFVISGTVDPRTIKPDFHTPMSSAHIEPKKLVEDIMRALS